ncbi:MAG TPA: cytochrome c oxidase assembly protein [Bacillales bacterium]|nr:cytochrome c oxidase assembly protein [Bacillales bacterium]
MDLFKDHGFLSLWNPILAALLLGVAIFYARRHEPRLREKLAFLSGLLLIYLVCGSPFAVVAQERWMTAFLFQQSVLYLVVPRLLFAGVPRQWLLPLRQNNSVKRTLQILTYPWLTAIVFNLGFSIYLLPSVFSAVHGNAALTAVVEGFFFLSALLMWWSILSPLPELNPLSEMQRIFYLFITALMLTPIAMLMLFSDQVLYPAYAGSAYLPAIYDQQLAAGVLKAFQLTVYSIEIVYLINHWIRNERIREQEKHGKPKVISFRKIR